ncbi:MAG TPA: helix-turn-helix domain-containing protein [Armatimonadota bacterium]
MTSTRFDVEMLVAHKSACGPDWRWENFPNNGNVLNLWCVLEGKGTLSLADRTVAVRSGDCFVVPMWEYALGEHDPTYPLTVLWTLFRYRGTTRRPDPSVLPARFRRINNLPFFSQLFERAITAFNADAPLCHQAAPWMSATLAALEEEDRRPALQDNEQEIFAQIQQICQRLQTNPGQRACVTTLAEECSISAGHFTRVFRRYTGVTPRDYIIQTKIDAAKSLLYLSNYSITRIAEVLGYRDVFHFSRQFRDRTSHSPSHFRRR